ncbi:MAG: hypothetical protein KIG65_09040 [Eubacteriales bacterium]|nr:hypothetical protein [Eubacteriales bacterium]
MKKLFRAVLFLLIAVFIFVSIDRILARKTISGWWNMTTKIHSFFNSEPDKYDVIFCGSSHAYCSFNPLVIGEETGLSSYTIATQKQPLWATYYYIKEAIERQNPSLIVLDCFAFSLTDEYADDATNYTFTDDFPFGINKLKMIKESAPSDKRFDLLFKFTKYHSRWSELTSEDFNYNPSELYDYLYGYCMLTSTAKDLVKNSSNDYIVTPSSDKNELWLKNIIKLCKEKNVELMIVKTPLCENDGERGYFERAKEIAEKNGVEFVYYNDFFDKIGLSLSTDFFDRAHLNYKGADKFSRYFAKTALSGISPKRALDDRFYNSLERYKREFNGDSNPFYYSPKFN